MDISHGPAGLEIRGMVADSRTEVKWYVIIENKRDEGDKHDVKKAMAHKGMEREARQDNQ